ncbi:leukocyte immunoglobulin-like receptor subfamily B member 1 [Sarcophilus harrisii]
MGKQSWMPNQVSLRKMQASCWASQHCSSCSSSSSSSSAVAAIGPESVSSWGWGQPGTGSEPQGRLTLTLPTGNGSRGAEVKKTSKSSYSASIPTEETLYIAVEDGRQTEEATQEDTAVPKGEDPQQVTYAQLNLCSLRAGTNNSPSSKPVEPSLYATLR